MMAYRRRKSREPAGRFYPQYEWALNEAGQPVPISHAVRGETYMCPLCHGRMIAKLGDIKRHHYAHDEITPCPPEEVARIAASMWLVQQLDKCLHAGRAVMLTWPCPVCSETHTANLLDGVARVAANLVRDGVRADVALLDPDDSLRAVVMVHTPNDDTLAHYAQHGIAVIEVKLDNIRTRMLDLERLLAGATIYGGWCTTQAEAAESGIVSDPSILRERLTHLANNWPYRFYKTLAPVGELENVLVIDDQKLWLPPILWQRAVGGMRHTMSPTLQVISQEWPQPDGGVIALFYITYKNEHAVAVRRFAIDQPVYARLGTATFRSPRITALEIARNFAEG